MITGLPLTVHGVRLSPRQSTSSLLRALPVSVRPSRSPTGMSVRGRLVDSGFTSSPKTARSLGRPLPGDEEAGHAAVSLRLAFTARRRDAESGCHGQRARISAWCVPAGDERGGWRSAGPVGRGVLLEAVEDHQPLAVVDLVDDAVDAASSSRVLRCERTVTRPPAPASPMIETGHGRESLSIPSAP